MKKVILLTICLVFVLSVGSAFASVPVPTTCTCDPELVTFQGVVKWFCCLFPDGSATVTIVDSAGKRVPNGGFVQTRADGSFSGSFLRPRSHICNGCCILWETFTAKTSSCVCVIGNKGKSAPVSITVTDCKQKDVSINFFTICENMVSCTDC
jgi:hypothetical protein